MSYFDRLDRHVHLINRMAASLGLNLNDEVAAGHLAPQDMRGLVTACSGCRAPVACEEYLDQGLAPEAEIAPGYCRNREMLNRLAALR